MKTATQNLEEDHVYILKLTEVMMAITKSADPDILHIEKTVEIIKNFADGLHHAKEEDLLFPKLGEKGFSREQGPVAVMIYEHTEGRNYVKGIVENIALLKQGTSGALNSIFVNMKGYAELLQNHISKENNILFKMADRMLSAAEQASLLEEFEKTEKEKGKVHPSSYYINSIKELAGIYNV